MFYLDCPCISDEMQNHITRYLNTDYPKPIVESGIFVEKGDPIFRWPISRPTLSFGQEVKEMVISKPRHVFELPSPISGTFYRGNDRSESFWGYTNKPSSERTPIAFSIATEKEPPRLTSFEIYQSFFAFMDNHRLDIDQWLLQLDGWDKAKDSYWKLVAAEQKKSRETFCSIRSA